MASTASDLLKIELQATGENDGTWGTKANTAFARMEEAIADITNISLASLSGANYTLDDTQYAEHVDGSNTSESHVAVIKATGVLNAAEKIIVPLRNKTYLVWNACTGAYAVTVGGSTGATIEVPQGTLMQVVCDGTNVEAASVAVNVDGDIRGMAQILDTNGNELIKFTTVASAVNEFTISDAATGNGPQLEATGDDTNIDIELIPKGTGVVKSGANAVADVGTNQTFTAAQRGSITGLTSGTTITPDMDNNNHFSVTLAHNATLANPTNLTAGQSGSIFITQDGTGSRTMAFGSYWDFGSGTAPTLTTTASAVDRIDYVVRTTTSIHAVAHLNLS